MSDAQITMLFYVKLAECPEHQCGEIRQMLTFLVGLP
jgi:hypothetical protein